MDRTAMNGGHQFTDGATINLLVALGIFTLIALRIDIIIGFIERWL